MPDHHIALLNPRQVFDRAFMGLTSNRNHPAPIAIYDYQACVDALAEWHGVDQIAAIDLALHSVLACCGGRRGPLLLYRPADFDPLPAAAAQAVPLAA